MTEAIKNTVDWLERHNKNYTKEQYYKILDLQEQIHTLYCVLNRAVKTTAEIIDNTQTDRGDLNRLFFEICEAKTKVMGIDQ